MLLLLFALVQDAWKPERCMSNQFTGELKDLKVGRALTYFTEVSGTKMTTVCKVVDQVGEDWVVEQWYDLGSLAYGYLFQVDKHKKIVKAWAAAKGDKAWTEILIDEPPKSDGSEPPKPEVKESEEKKAVKAGEFACKRVQVSVTVGGQTYESSTWYSKDVWSLLFGSEHGGVVAMESTGMKMWLEAKAEDAKPTIELPKR